MFIPSIFKDSLVDDWSDFPFNNDFFTNRKSLSTTNAMKTDIRELERGYEVEIDLPGFKKEEISVNLENGYLTISASKKTETEEKNEEGKYLRRERFYGNMSRSFYLGDSVKIEDIQAKFEGGILKLSLPKITQSEIDAKSTIQIEG